MSKICGRPDRARDRIFCSSKIPYGGFSSARQEGIDLLGGLLAGLGFGFLSSLEYAALHHRRARCVRRRSFEAFVRVRDDLWAVTQKPSHPLLRFSAAPLSTFRL